MTELYFFRHGIAEDGWGKPDFARQLTPEGRYALRRQVVGLQRLGFKPDRLFSSPFVRAMQTAEILGHALSVPIEKWDGLGCGAMLDDVIELMEVQDYPSKVVIVGHQPDLGEMVYMLTGQSVAVEKGAMIHVRVQRFGLLGGELIKVYEPEIQMAL